MMKLVFAAGLFVATTAACKDREPPPRPRPIVDVVTISAGEFVGQVSTCPEVAARESTVLSRPDIDGDVRQRLDGFEIERDLVPCEDWLQCKRAGVCRSTVGCDHYEQTDNLPRERFASMNHREATRLCAWRGGRLPTLPELQRALRGTDGQKYTAGWNHDLTRFTCTTPVDLRKPTSTRKGCEQRSPDGVVYYERGELEWTSTMSCRRGRRPSPAFLHLGPTLTDMASVPEPNLPGFVRCVRVTGSTPDATAPAARR